MTSGYYGSSANSHPHGGTPDDLLESIKEEFGELFDPCPNNPTFDGLTIDWPQDMTVYCNPPYTRGVITEWIRKCHNQWRKGSTVVLLIPSYTDTVAFHRYIYPYAELRFIRGRLKFKGYSGQASFPSMLAIFNNPDRCMWNYVDVLEYGEEDLNAVQCDCPTCVEEDLAYERSL